MKFLRSPACFVLLFWSVDSSASVILTEDFESPVIVSGGSVRVLPTGWVSHNGSTTNKRMIYPTGSSQFNTVAPLSAPAGGNQALLLRTLNQGTFRMTGHTILNNTDYLLSAAIGNSILEEADQYWSLQLWADTNGSNSLDAPDTFLKQEFGTNGAGTAMNATSGNWITNSVSFNSSTDPSVVGQQLIVFLNNYGDANSESYYDNVMLSIVPEPSRAIMLLSGLLLLQFHRQR
ncbi:MAG: hypothetical protein IPK22_09995 [Verrucomicrobiaceae bacterium]|nr:hypothetical protein [Verrucomicrobiaceae bacterium]